MVDTVRPSATNDGLRQFYYGSVGNEMPLVVEFKSEPLTTSLTGSCVQLQTTWIQKRL